MFNQLTVIYQYYSEMPQFINERPQINKLGASSSLFAVTDHCPLACSCQPPQPHRGERENLLFSPARPQMPPERVVTADSRNLHKSVRCVLGVAFLAFVQISGAPFLPYITYLSNLITVLI
jgi:hypothetical protein